MTIDAAAATASASACDLAYQKNILQGVSRTFALTIPQLPESLAVSVGNAYLLCRIADTIEDEPTLDSQRKRDLSEAFIEVVTGERAGEGFAADLLPRLSHHTTGPEQDLVRNTPTVVRITHRFDSTVRGSLERCVRIMSRGMAEFQQSKNLAGLEDLPHLDRYCYHVAGVVGEMLTELFCDYCPRIDRSRQELLKLSVSFGQGLQMTNILKDIWEDRKRGACWLPRDVFQRVGFDLEGLSPEPRGHGPEFEQGLAELIGIARGHLHNALGYTLMLPRSEPGIRRFCLRALAMAVLTLRKIYAGLHFTAGSQAKISRNSVRATVIATNALAGRDASLRFLFGAFTRPLPASDSYHQVLLV